MPTVKTAVSLDRPLFEQAEALAREMKTSRSRLVALALEEFIRRHQNSRLLREINAAYQDEPDAAEQAVKNRMRRQQREAVEGEW